MSHAIADRVRGIHSFGDLDVPVLYNFLVAEAPAGSTIVEVGNFCGRSLIYLALMAKESGKGLRIVGVDHGIGMNENGSQPTIGLLRENVKRFGVEDVVELVVEKSVDGAKRFADESVFAAFIDDAHDFSSVRLSIQSWLPKVQRGGYLTGHDTIMHTVWLTLEDILPDWTHGPTTHCWYWRKP